MTTRRVSILIGIVLGVTLAGPQERVSHRRRLRSESIAQAICFV